MTENPITPTIPLDAEGAHHGFLRLPYSRDDSAWGAVMIPISVIASGAGPTALLTGGNHGDEYEGPIALQELAATLRPGDITGRVIVLPMMNLPAFAAGRRCSPIDGGNMNRSFPGRPDGTVTQKIAHYIASRLVPLADALADRVEVVRDETLEGLRHPFGATLRVTTAEGELTARIADPSGPARGAPDHGPTP